MQSPRAPSHSPFFQSGSMGLNGGCVLPLHLQPGRVTAPQPHLHGYIYIYLYIDIFLAPRLNTKIVSLWL